MLAILRNPYVLAGAGGIALLGATIHQHANNVSKNTGFHFKDPDPSLRIVEKDVVIPKRMMLAAQKVKCRAEALEFQHCVEETEPNTWARFMTFRSCKKQSDNMMQCMDQYFTDYNFYLEIKEIYLEEKTLYRMSKVMTKDRIKIKTMVRGSESPDQLSGDARTYFSAVKEEYDKTQNIDAFDDSILSKHREKLSGMKKNSVASSIS